MGMHANDTPTKRAVALAYQPDRDPAPQVLATGERLAAERMIELAKGFGVPVVEDAPLAASLASLELGALVPPELYQAVAEILAFVYRLDDRYSRRNEERPCTAPTSRTPTTRPSSSTATKGGTA